MARPPGAQEVPFPLLSKVLPDLLCLWVGTESEQCPGRSEAGQRPALLLLKPEQDYLHFNFPNSQGTKIPHTMQHSRNKKEILLCLSHLSNRLLFPHFFPTSGKPPLSPVPLQSQSCHLAMSVTHHETEWLTCIFSCNIHSTGGKRAGPNL